MVTRIPLLSHSTVDSAFELTIKAASLTRLDVPHCIHAPLRLRRRPRPSAACVVVGEREVHTPQKYRQFENDCHRMWTCLKMCKKWIIVTKTTAIENYL